jgi:ribosomal protein L28
MMMENKIRSMHQTNQRFLENLRNAKFIKYQKSVPEYKTKVTK